MAKSSLRTNLFVSMAALLIIAVSVIVTLYASGLLFSKPMGANSAGYQNVTFTDAVVSCQNRVKSDYGKKIQTLVVDAHSSRYAEKQFIYKIFLNLDIYNKNRTMGKPYYVNCFVKSSSGRISKYEVFSADKEKGSDVVVDDGTNRFGIKRREKK